jgi:hypothetical protein
MNLIEDFKDVVSYYLDAPDIFIEVAAYHNVSALLGRFFRCSCLPGSSYGAKPNLWFIISSIPGRTRRSTIMEYAGFVYRHSLQQYFRNVFKIDEKASMNKVYDTIIEEGTPEGIMDHINATGLETYMLSSTEFGSVLMRMGSKDYEMGVSTLYSKLYYGESGSMLLSQRGKDAVGKRFLPGGLYTTMFCGMQEPYLYLTPAMSRQGLLRRVILTYCDPKDIKRWKPPMSEERESIYGELRRINDKFVDKMMNYGDKASKISPFLLDISFHSEAIDIINEYAKKNDEALRTNVTNVNIYMQSFWEHLAKLSMINAISRDSIKLVHGEWIAFVNLEDCTSALEFLTKATKHTPDIISNLGKVDDPIRTSREPIERIFGIIESSGELGIQRKELYRKANMKAEIIESFINTLIMQERIAKVVGKPTGGRTPVQYKVIKDII